MESKGQARGRFRALRKESRSPDRTAPGRFLLDAPEINSARVVASFASYGDEPDTAELHKILQGRGVTIYLPRINDDKSLTWLYDQVEVNIDKLKQVDAVIVPALAIDHRGVRLGQGGGSFDRALPALSGWKVALIDYVCLTQEELPEEAHDCRVDAVATERGIVRFN